MVDQVIKIEPYWNVNAQSKEKWYTGGLIKIEPYWNVNSESTAGYLSDRLN